MPATRRRLLAFALLGVGAAMGQAPSLAQESAVTAMGTAFRPVEVGSLRIENGSALAAPGGASAGKAFLTIVNRGDQPDRIVSVSSPSSRETRVFTIRDGNTAEKVEGLEIPAHGTIAMGPDGPYVDFRNVTEVFQPGGEVAVTLTFEKAGAVGLRLPVTAAR